MKQPNRTDRGRSVKSFLKVLPALLISISMTGCQLIPPLETGTPSTEAQDVQKFPAENQSSGSTSSVPEVTAASPKTGETVLEKYRASRKEIHTESMTQQWTLESSYPLKTGEIHLTAAFSPDGQWSQAMGSRKESYSGTSELTEWSLDGSSLTVIRDGESRVYPRSGIRQLGAYDFDAFLEKMLLNYTVSREGESFIARATIQEQQEIREFMGYLGYTRTDETDFTGRLVLDVELDASRGTLNTINYVFENETDGFSDAGQITFSGRNEPYPEEP